MGENSFRINGDVFKNQFVLVDIKSHEFHYNYYARGIYNYKEEYENMSVQVSGTQKVLATSPVVRIEMDFNQLKGPGIYTLDSAISFSIYFKQNVPGTNHDYHYLLDSDGEINIQVYENIGGLIEGTFAGAFTKIVFNKATGTYTESDTMVTITDGKFSVRRYPDFHWNVAKSTGKEPEDFKKKKKKDRKSK